MQKYKVSHLEHLTFVVGIIQGKDFWTHSIFLVTFLNLDYRVWYAVDIIYCTVQKIN